MVKTSTTISSPNLVHASSASQNRRAEEIFTHEMTKGGTWAGGLGEVARWNKTRVRGDGCLALRAFVLFVYTTLTIHIASRMPIIFASMYDCNWTVRLVCGACCGVAAPRLDDGRQAATVDRALSWALARAFDSEAN